MSKRNAKIANVRQYDVPSDKKRHGNTSDPAYCVKLRYHGSGKPPPETPRVQGPATLSVVTKNTDTTVAAIPKANIKGNSLFRILPKKTYNPSRATRKGKQRNETPRIRGAETDEEL